jgi:uncharacterized membrane protein
MTSASDTLAPTGGRVAGIDAARAAAVVGMVMVHVGPTGQSDIAGRLYALPHGRASVLFVLLAGVGVSLLAGAQSRIRVRRMWGHL